MRDLETMEAALKLAETGHLTLATLHTNSAAQTVTRIIDAFPANQQSQIRTQLSLVLEGIVCQALLPKASGQGRVAALEILVATPAIRNLIREDKIHQIYGTMQAGQERLGMQTMNQALARLVERRVVTRDVAMTTSSNREELQTIIERGVPMVTPVAAPRPVARQEAR
jgi:twitching motility protein PilT